MKKTLVILTIILLVAASGLLLRQNLLLEDKVRTLTKAVQMRDKQLQESERMKQAIIDQYEPETVNVVNEKTGEVKTIPKDKLGQYGLLGDDDTYYMCRYSREVVAQKALEYGASLKDIEEVVGVYDITCK